MNKGLEALKEIERFIGKNIDNATEEESRDLGFYVATIENELKAFEEYVEIAEKEHEQLMYAQKKLKALEIIKNNKDIRIAVLSSCKKWDEYDLLKEVLE